MGRSAKKGPFVDERLMKRIEEMNTANEKRIVRTWSRSSTVFPEMVGHTIAIHDGRRERVGAHRRIVEVRSEPAWPR